MKVTCDPEVDVLRILFRDVPIEESDEDKPGVILDYDKDGNLVGMEVLKWVANGGALWLNIWRMMRLWSRPT